MFLFLPIFYNPFLILILPYTLVAGIYREKLRVKYGADVCELGSLRLVSISARDFDSGLFSCCSGHKGIRKFLFTFFCCPVRLSANSSATGFSDYWSMLIMASIFLPFIFIIGYIHRLHVRTSYNMEPHPIRDFFSWMFCTCCALVQESKFIDHGFQAIKTGTMIVFINEP